MEANKDRISVGDGMTHVLLNMGREEETLKMLCKCINRSAGIDQLTNSIFVLNNFGFDFDWDFKATCLRVGITCDDFEFLFPGAFHERSYKSKDIITIMGQQDKEEIKREILRFRSIFIAAPEEIPLDDLIETLPSVGIMHQEPIHIPKPPEVKIENVEDEKKVVEEQVREDRWMIKDHWLVYLNRLQCYQEEKVSPLFATFGDLLSKCR